MNEGKRFKNLLYFAPRFVLVALAMGLLALMALSNFDLLEPYLYPLHAARGPIVSYGSTITIGHYPHRYELERLKKERGIDLDLSLMNNELPQERALNRLLAERAAELGIEFKNIPFDYFSIDGPRNRERLAELVEFLKANGTRKIYIHCYLGRHRVKVVHDELTRQGLLTAAAGPGGV